MQGAALRLARFLERRGRLVAVLWLVVVAVSVPLALRQSEDLTGSGFDVPGSGSDDVRRAVDRDFPDADQAQLAAVLVAQAGARPAALTTAVGRLETELAGVPAVSIPPGAKELGLRTAASGVVVVSLSTRTGDEQAADVASEVREALQVGEARDGVVAHVIGITAFVDATADVLEEDLASAEAIGLPVVLVILLVVFGSLAAACLPLALAIASVTVTGALIFAVSQVMDVYIVATNLASLVGVGVAVDYSLFILARYREEIHAGREPEAARARALATSGLAVMFSGATVIASLAAIWTIDSSALRSLALGAILVVAVSVLASTTLLLPLLRLFGRRAWEPGRLRSLVGAPSQSFWSSWTDRVTRRPILAVAVSTSLLLALALPALSIDMRSSVLGQLPRDHEARVGFERAARMLGPGVVGQARVLLSLPDAERPATATRAAELGRLLARDPAVASVAPAVQSDDGRSALLFVTPAYASESPAAKAAVVRWRHDLPAAAGPDAEVAVGGASAAQLDYENQVRGSMWRILLFVLLVCYAVLVFLLRSLVVPLKAVHRQPALGRGRVRRDRDRVPVGLVRRAVRLRIARVRRAHGAPDRARARLRPLDGLRGVPALPRPRAVRDHR